MTILEAAYKSGIKEYVASTGDNLMTVCNKIYADYDDVYFLILKTLNLRYDWFCLSAGTVIKYLSKEVVKELYEVTG